MTTCSRLLRTLALAGLLLSTVGPIRAWAQPSWLCELATSSSALPLPELLREAYRSVLREGAGPLLKVEHLETMLIQNNPYHLDSSDSPLTAVTEMLEELREFARAGEALPEVTPILLAEAQVLADELRRGKAAIDQEIENVRQPPLELEREFTVEGWPSGMRVKLPAGGHGTIHHPFAVTPDSRWLFIRPKGQKALLAYDLTARNTQPILIDFGEEAPQALSISTDSKTIWSADWTGGIKRTRIGSWQPELVASLSRTDGFHTLFRLAVDEVERSFFVIGEVSGDQYAEWQLLDGSAKETFDRLYSQPTVDFMGDSGSVVISHEGAVAVQDAPQAPPRPVTADQPERFQRAGSQSPDGRYWTAYGANRKSVFKYDANLASVTFVAELEGREFQETVSEFFPASPRLLVRRKESVNYGNLDHSIRIFDLRTATFSHVFELPEPGLRSELISISPDENLLAAALTDGSLAIFEVESRKLIYRERLPADHFLDIAFIEGTNRILVRTGHDTGVLRLYRFNRESIPHFE